MIKSCRLTSYFFVALSTFDVDRIGLFLFEIQLFINDFLYENYKTDKYDNESSRSSRHVTGLKIRLA